MEIFLLFQKALEILEEESGLVALDQEKETFFLSALGCVNHKIALAQSAGYAVNPSIAVVRQVVKKVRNDKFLFFDHTHKSHFCSCHF